jgi:biopolymer transport protein ExbB/TolQ
MVILTNILFFISSALLIPVIVLLLGSFIVTLMKFGDLYGEYIYRIKKHKRTIDSIKKAKTPKEINIKELLYEDNLFKNSFIKLDNFSWQELESEMILKEYQLEAEKIDNKNNILTKTGPMLGLMGTLIPLGPALVGLASGDIQSMAVNMQVAFATTVIGVLIGALGLIVTKTKSLWLSKDLLILEYLYLKFKVK